MGLLDRLRGYVNAARVSVAETVERVSQWIRPEAPEAPPAPPGASEQPSPGPASLEPIGPPLVAPAPSLTLVMDEEGRALAIGVPEGVGQELDLVEIEEPIPGGARDDYDVSDPRLRVDFGATVRGRGFQYQAEGLIPLAWLVLDKVERSNLRQVRGASPDLTFEGGAHRVMVPGSVVDQGAEAVLNFIAQRVPRTQWSMTWRVYADSALFDDYDARIFGA